MPPFDVAAADQLSPAATQMAIWVVNGLLLIGILGSILWSRPGRRRNGPLTMGYEGRLAAHRRYLRVLAVTFLVMNVIVFGGTHLVSVLGENVEATNLKTRTWWRQLTRSGTKTYHWGITAEYEDPRSGKPVTLDGEVSVSTYYHANKGTITRVPFRVVRAVPYFHDVGHGATISNSHAMLPAFLVVLVLYLYRRAVATAR